MNSAGNIHKKQPFVKITKGKNIRKRKNVYVENEEVKEDDGGGGGRGGGGGGGGVGGGGGARKLCG